MSKQENNISFKDYVANIYPDDTAIKKDYPESDLVEFYPDLHEAYAGGFKSKKEHVLSYLKDIDDIHEYLETSMQEDLDIKSIKYSIELLLSRLNEMEVK